MHFGLALSACSFMTGPARACTIFVLTDTNRALFCNNEDWSNPNTRIWFVPGKPKHYGAVYVGFDNGWAQGGLNSEGLAFDWVAGYKEVWDPDPSMPRVWRNERVLETCATVEETIPFYREQGEPSFPYAKIRFFADCRGTCESLPGSERPKLRTGAQAEGRGTTLPRQVLA